MNDPHLDSRRRFLKASAHTMAALGSASGLVSLLSACGTSVSGKDAGLDFSKGLQPAIDPTTGKALLKLPQGFRYFSFGHKGEALANGGVIPSSADGMGLVSYQTGRATLIRNQEIWDDRGYFSLPELAYDTGAGGGTVTLDVDLNRGKLTRAITSLSGTNANCSGGKTPWGSWLSGEEQVVVPGVVINDFSGNPMRRFTKAHGYMFEVSAEQIESSFKPIVEMGQMRHEAAAVDPISGIVYLTEDNSPAAGFFRFVPNKKDKLRAGGKLQMLAVEGRTDLRSGIRELANQKRPFKTRWIDIADPTKAHHDVNAASNGCYMQGALEGGAAFTRLEGIYIRGDEVFFTATNGGDIAQGQVFVYRPKTSELELIFESTDRQVMNYPDAIEKGPNGGHVICQDGKEIFPQVLYYLSATAKVSNIAQINADSEPDMYSEWSGCSMSPDGQWLFANVYTPGYSVAITGPFEAWAKAQA